MEGREGELPRGLREAIEVARQEQERGGALEAGAEERAEYSYEAGRGRFLEDYERLFGLSDKDFEGKTVLDLGAGNTHLQRELAEKHIAARVVGPDPAEGSKTTREGRVFGVGQQVPFREESFDLIVAAHSVPQWIFGKKEKALRGDERVPKEDEEFFASEMKQIFDECARVLKHGGRAIFGPDTIYYGEEMESHLHQRRAPKKLSPSQQWQVLEALQEYLKLDPSRNYEVFTEHRGRNTNIILTKTSDLTRPKGTAMRPPDTRRKE